MSIRQSIAELPSSTVKLITATQVATSVTNIVKELVENSLDAGSTIIRVKLENSGFSKIEVTDNGSGVSKDDIQKMALPHFTSKISCHEDLESLITYGFRGEALAAVCAIGKLTVTTKTSEDSVAFSYTMDGVGNVIDSKPSHLSLGTQIVVSSLFWNLPVRKQFYQTAKKKKEEVLKVEELLMCYGLIHPELHLSFHHDSSLIWQKTRVCGFKANVIQTLGHSVCSNMEFVEEQESFKLFMMFPKRAALVDLCFRHKPDRCFIYVNQRPVICKEIEKLMKELYAFVQDPNQKSSLYPVFLISLQVPGDQVDVNLEPNKTHVLLKNQAEILNLIRDRVIQFLGESIPEILVPCNDKTELENNSSVHISDCNTGQSMNSQAADKQSFENGPFLNPITCINETLFSDSYCEKEPATRKSSLEITISEEILEDDQLFHGFDEPFLAETEETLICKKKKNTIPPPVSAGPEGFPAIGSEEWAKGWATGSDGNFIHPIEVLRGQPHFSKRISESAPGNTSKKARLNDSGCSSLSDSQPSLLERVNNYSRKITPDPFGEYCREKKNELLALEPSMNFAELSQQLNEGWKNLSKRERESYVAKATPLEYNYTTNKNKLFPPKMSAIKGNMSLDRFLVGQQPPVLRTSVPSTSPSAKSLSMEIHFSLEILMEALGSPTPKCSWVCFKKLEQGGWLCSNGEEVMGVNFTRLYEMILFSRLANSYVLPSRPITNQISIDARTLKTQQVWDTLTKLSTDYDSPNGSFISDPRIVSNGLKLRLITDPTGPGVHVLSVPASINNFDLGDIMKLLLRIAKDESTVETCRPDQIIRFLETEAARLAAQRCTEPDYAEVSELLEQWLSTDPENACLHGEPVVWSYVINPSNRGSEIPERNEHFCVS